MQRAIKFNLAERFFKTLLSQEKQTLSFTFKTTNYRERKSHVIN